MTRTDIHTEYTVVEGRIRNPGKFEGDPVYLPAFWESAMEGFAEEIYMPDDPERPISRFDLTEDDYKEWPELTGTKTLLLWEDDQGFVRHKHLNEAEAGLLDAQLETAESDPLEPNDALDVAETWREDEHGEYVRINDDGSVCSMAHGSTQVIIVSKAQAEEHGERSEWVFERIRWWMDGAKFWPNIWYVNERGNVTLYDAQGNDLGGLV